MRADVIVAPEGLGYSRRDLGAAIVRDEHVPVGAVVGQAGPRGYFPIFRRFWMHRFTASSGVRAP